MFIAKFCTHPVLCGTVHLMLVKQHISKLCQRCHVSTADVALCPVKLLSATDILPFAAASWQCLLLQMHAMQAERQTQSISDCLRFSEVMTWATQHADPFCLLQVDVLIDETYAEDPTQYNFATFLQTFNLTSNSASNATYPFLKNAAVFRWDLLTLSFVDVLCHPSATYMASS